VRRRVFRIVLTGAVVVAAFVLVWPRGEREPVYQGKKLSEWTRGVWRLATDEPGFLERKQAVLQIGTNALPFLVKWIGEGSEPAVGKLDGIISRLNPGAQRLWIRFRYRKLERASDAVAAFAMLGADGRSAIPELRDLARSRTNLAVNLNCTLARAAVGDPDVRLYGSILKSSTANPKVDSGAPARRTVE
jgi:hypothetical protein